MERLQKYLAEAGVASRRRAEEFIKAGRVKVNGRIISELGYKVDTGKDQVLFDGKEVRPAGKHVYLMLNKPLRVVTTVSDPQGRKKVTDYIAEDKGRVYPVGRLDYMTEGLLLLTNDGELSHRLMHPAYKVEKTYLVTVQGNLDKEALEKLRRGVVLEDGPAMPVKVRVIKRGQGSTVLEITLHEGRNRLVRRMLSAVGYNVVALKRIRFGPLSLGKLVPGKYRRLTEGEIASLKKACRLI